MKKYPTISLLMFLVLTSFVNAQTFHVAMKDGTNAYYKTDSVLKLTFQGPNLIISLKNNTSISQDIFSIQKTDFNTPVVSDVKPISDNSKTGNLGFTAYPNPASNFVSLQFNLPVSSEIQIQWISITGEVIREEFILAQSNNQFQYESNIDFPDGLYLCRAIILNQSFTTLVRVETGL